MQFIQEAPPIKVHGAVVASFGGMRPFYLSTRLLLACKPCLCAQGMCAGAAADDPSLGCPVEYIDLRGTSIDNPAVCKYTGTLRPGLLGAQLIRMLC